MTNIIAITKNPVLGFSTQQADYLKNLNINSSFPGTLLKDFNTLLGLIGADGLAVSETAHIFAMKVLPNINQRMSKPIQPKTVRPTQKTFPHINGLYLLLRASGLATVQVDKKKARLILDPALMLQWQLLNDTEQYFALFQAWTLQYNDEIVSESNRFDASCFEECYYFLKESICESSFARDVSSLRYRPGLHRLALLELFGFVTIELNALDEKNHWPVARVIPTEFGQAIIRCIANIEFKNTDYYDDQMVESWLDELKNYFPAWQKNLQLEQSKIENKIVTLKVILEKSYRTIAVSSELSLEQLAAHILSAFSFDQDHLYEFKYKNRCGITQRIVHPYIEDHDGMTTDDAYVGDLPLQVGAEIIFHFDFGDDWLFKILVEEIEDKTNSQATFKLLEKVGKAPKQYGY